MTEEDIGTLPYDKVRFCTVVPPYVVSCNSNIILDYMLLIVLFSNQKKK